MTIVLVDGHCHTSTRWFEPIEILLSQMEQNGVQHAVLTQDASELDNGYFFECARRYPGRFAVVVTVDATRPDADEALKRLADQGASGVRFHQTARSPGDDPLKIWRVAQRLGLSVSCNGKGAYYASEKFAALVAALPDLPIAIEHLGSLNQVEKDPVPIETRREVFTLARFPNVYMKLHGLGEFCRRVAPAVGPFPFEQPIPPLFEMAYDAFGPGRLIWGSDYPPVSAREGYRNALALALEQFASKSEEDQRQIFGGVALTLFPVRG